MKTMVVGAAILNQIPLDWDGNQRRIVAAIHAARAKEVALLCLPEMAITGYGCEDAFHAQGTLENAERILQELLPETTGMMVTFGIPVLFSKTLFNVAAVAVDGRLVAVVPKRFLAGDGVHYEPRWFKPWPAAARATIILAGHEVPIGDLIIEAGGVKIGFEICEDAWVADRPGAALARAGVDIILNPSASHFAFGKLAIRERFVAEGSRAFNVTYVYANLLGNEAGRTIYDGGALIATAGTIVALGPRLGFQEWHVTCATVDIESARFASARSASFRPDLQLAEHAVVVVAFPWPAAGLPTGTFLIPAWEASPFAKEEEFSRAIALALFDYLRKSRSKGFVLSLSGGADSSAVATLVWLMVRRGVEDLGFDGFQRRLAHIPALAGIRAIDGLVRALLTTVYQPSANSSQETRDAARSIAAAIGCEHLEIDIEPLVASYTAAVGAALHRSLTWAQDDLALQNIQARARAPGVWMIANIREALLLATSNRSEAAVGYATMDGDTCGGLSPIAGIDKAFLRRWLSWMVQSGPDGIGPLPALAVVTSQRSTPELRPQASEQVSESDLMPFPILDAIERLAIRDKQSPVIAFRVLRERFPEVGAEILRQHVVRFFQLWCRNQWKRERYAPSFHLDDENLDPKTWCRFPILSGGFERELRELRALPLGESSLRST